MILRRAAPALVLASAVSTACALPSSTPCASSDVPLLARDGTPLQWVRTDATARRGPWLALVDISPALRQAIVYSEDRRFWEHGGVG